MLLFSSMLLTDACAPRGGDRFSPHGPGVSGLLCFTTYTTWDVTPPPTGVSWLFAAWGFLLQGYASVQVCGRLPALPSSALRSVCF